MLGVLRLTTAAFSTASSCVTSCWLAPVTTIDNGTPRPSTSRWRLLPLLCPIRWVGAKRLLRQRRFEHGPVDALPSPSDSFHLVTLGEPDLPHGLEHASALPLDESLLGCAGTAKALFRKSLPLAPRAQHVHDCFEDLSRRLGWPPYTGLSQILSDCSAPAYRHQRFDALPQIIGHHPRLNSLARCQFFAWPPREL